MNGNFIVINRKMLDWEWYKDTNTVRLFFHCLLKANWKDGKFEGKEIYRGSFVTSRKSLAKETGLSEQQIRTSLIKLISTNEITKSATNKYTIITITKYNEYQDYNPQSNQRATNNQPTSNQQITTIEQYKQSNKETNNNNNNNIYDFVEQNFGRALSPIEYEEIKMWNDTDLTRYAIKQAVISNKCSIKYISRILFAYGRENIKTVQQAQEREREYAEAKKKKEYVPKKEYKSGLEKFKDVLKSIPDD